jgi:hypothetical protein
VDAAITQGLTEELTATTADWNQRTMETNILSLEAGSMAQQVQAEFLQEMHISVSSLTSNNSLE